MKAKAIILFGITTAIILILCLGSKVSAQVNDPDHAILKIGEKITVNSKALNEPREIWVYLPQNYHDKYFQTVQYPVLYMLDGDIHFQSVCGMVQVLGSARNGLPVIPEMIVVAIPNTDRTKDLTPTHSLKGVFGKEEFYLGSSGGGDYFLKFIKDELIPTIDSTYSTSSYRIFAGHSFGGLEVIHALYTTPQTFSAYISIDPSLWWDDKALVKQGANYFNTANLQGKFLFLAQANTLSGKDTINNHYNAIKEFESLLEHKNPSQLNWSYKYYQDETHSSVPFIAEYDGLRYIFNEYPPNLGEFPAPKDLKDHYQLFSNKVNVKFTPPERMVNQFGNIAMFMKKDSLAQAYFQMNLENYPQSSSAYASMGQFWQNKGDKAMALKYYEKSLDLYHGNENAKNNIKQIREDNE